MKKRWISILLALVLTVALLPTSAQAATVQDKAGTNLAGVERRLYEAMESNVAAVASGSRTSTSITISLKSDEMSWTARELGLSRISRGNVSDSLDQKFNETLDLEKIYTCLELNFPFEMFWAYNAWHWSYNYRYTDSKAWITDITFSLDAAPAYRGGSISAVDSGKIARARSVMETVESIVQANEYKSDYEKLTAYRDAICARVSYNWDVYKEWVKDDHMFGDPWQLIYVFDDDPATNVLCEGYAKAFKLLCDLSEFDGDVTCYLVEGTMGYEGHMWNVVRMGDGNFYMVDVTNSDTGMAGEHGGLFLAGASGSGQRYVVSNGKWEYTYTYREDQAGLFTGGYLPLSAAAYSPDSDSSVRRGFEDVPASEYYAEPVAWAVKHGITTGTSPTTFSPSDPCTHAQIITFLWRAMGEPAGEGDAPAGADQNEYYYEAVRWAAGLDMLWEEFDPNAGCSRADAVWYMWNANLQPEADLSSSFQDVPDTSVYADAVNWAVSREITKGTGETAFDPWTICTRGQIVTFLYRSAS